MILQIYTDASVSRQTHEAGFAWWICCYQFSLQSAGYIGRSTTGKSEMHAVAMATDYLLSKELIPLQRIEIVTDSTETLHKLRTAQCMAFFNLIKLVQKNGMEPHTIWSLVTLSHVKAHTRGRDDASNKNRWCDLAAKRARKNRKGFKSVIFDNSDILV